MKYGTFIMNFFCNFAHEFNPFMGKVKETYGITSRQMR